MQESNNVIEFKPRDKKPEKPVADKYRFKAYLKNETHCIAVEPLYILQSGYFIDIGKVYEAFENKYGKDGEVYNFLDDIETQKTCQEISNDADIIIINGFNNLVQCTGLKDKNGKLIFEGDILKVECGGYPKCNYILQVVVWDRRRYVLARPQKCNCESPQKQCIHCERIPMRKHWFFQNNDPNFKNFIKSEIVGNIYENFDLFERAQA